MSLKLLENGVKFAGDLVIKNRMALAPLTRGRSGRSQVPNDVNSEYYVQRSTAGLVISEGTIISEQAMVNTCGKCFRQSTLTDSLALIGMGWSSCNLQTRACWGMEEGQP